MSSGDLDAAIDRLYAVALEEFVPERARLAKELRSEGERPAAAEVAKLPKPTAPAWALNRLAREEPDPLATWLDAAERLREASSNATTVGGDAIRAAAAAHRTATSALMGIVRDLARPGGKPLSEPMLDRVRALLHGATADVRLAERLRAGRMTEVPLEPADAGEPDDGGPQKAPRTARRPAAPERDREAEQHERRRKELEARVIVAGAEAERLHRQVADRAEAAATADERLEEARRTLTRSQSEADAAHGAFTDSEAAAATADLELDRLRALLRRAGA